MARYEYSLRVGIGHVGGDGLLRPQAAMDMLLNCSWFQMDTETAIQDFFRRENAGMYMAGRQLEFLRMPAYGEKVTIVSWIYAANRLMGDRNTLMYGENGEVLIASVETGVFMNLKTGGPARIDQALLASFEMLPAYEVLTVLPRKIPLPESGGVPAASFTVRARHLDSYLHMNNTRYLEEALDALPDGHPVGRLRVIYQKPAKAGDLITPVVYRQDGGSIVALLSADGTPHAVVEIG